MNDSTLIEMGLKDEINSRNLPSTSLLLMSNKMTKRVRKSAILIVKWVPSQISKPKLTEKQSRVWFYSNFTAQLGKCFIMSGQDNVLDNKPGPDL